MAEQGRYDRDTSGPPPTEFLSLRPLTFDIFYPWPRCNSATNFDWANLHDSKSKLPTEVLIALFYNQDSEIFKEDFTPSMNEALSPERKRDKVLFMGKKYPILEKIRESFEALDDSIQALDTESVEWKQLDRSRTAGPSVSIAFAEANARLREVYLKAHERYLDWQEVMKIPQGRRKLLSENFIQQTRPLEDRIADFMGRLGTYEYHKEFNECFLRFDNEKKLNDIDLLELKTDKTGADPRFLTELQVLKENLDRREPHVYGLLVTYVSLTLRIEILLRANITMQLATRIIEQLHKPKYQIGEVITGQTPSQLLSVNYEPVKGQSVKEMERNENKLAKIRSEIWGKFLWYYGILLAREWSFSFYPVEDGRDPVRDNSDHLRPISPLPQDARAWAENAYESLRQYQRDFAKNWEIDEGTVCWEEDLDAYAKLCAEQGGSHNLPPIRSDTRLDLETYRLLRTGKPLWTPPKHQK